MELIYKYATLFDMGTDFAEQVISCYSYVVNNFDFFDYTYKDPLVANRLNWLYYYIEETRPILEEIKAGADYGKSLEKLGQLLLDDDLIKTYNKRNNWQAKGNIQTPIQNGFF